MLYSVAILSNYSMFLAVRFTQASTRERLRSLSSQFCFCLELDAAMFTYGSILTTNELPSVTVRRVMFIATCVLWRVASVTVRRAAMFTYGSIPTTNELPSVRRVMFIASVQWRVALRQEGHVDVSIPAISTNKLPSWRRASRPITTLL